MNDQQLLAELLALDPSNEVGALLQRRLRTKSEQQLTPELQAVVVELRDQAAERAAASLLARDEFRVLICPGLQRVGDDIFEILKFVGPAMFTLAVAGVAVPVLPVVAASVALLIARGGIATICHNVLDGDGSEAKK